MSLQCIIPALSLSCFFNECNSNTFFVVSSLSPLVNECNACFISVLYCCQIDDIKQESNSIVHKFSPQSHMSCCPQSQTVQGEGPKETGFNNSCLLQSRRQHAGPKELDCAKFVVESTDKIWNMYRGELQSWRCE